MSVLSGKLSRTMHFDKENPWVPLDAKDRPLRLLQNSGKRMLVREEKFNDVLWIEQRRKEAHDVLERGYKKLDDRFTQKLRKLSACYAVSKDGELVKMEYSTHLGLSGYSVGGFYECADVVKALTAPFEELGLLAMQEFDEKAMKIVKARLEGKETLHNEPVYIPHRQDLYEVYTSLSKRLELVRVVYEAYTDLLMLFMCERNRLAVQDARRSTMRLFIKAEINEREYIFLCTQDYREAYPVSLFYDPLDSNTVMLEQRYNSTSRRETG